MIPAIASLFFPPACLACDATLLQTRALFCADCLVAMPRLDPYERCSTCFQLLETPVCRVCKNSCMGFRLAAVFPYDSPASALIKQLKYSGCQELAPVMASWMVVQLHELGFSWPDAIIPVPQSFPRRLVRGYNPSYQLASAMSQLMGVPLLRALRRTWKAFPQAGKEGKERRQMSRDEFSLRSSSSLVDKTLLLVDDVITTGTTMRSCVAALQPSFPRTLYALGFCQA